VGVWVWEGKRNAEKLGKRVCGCVGVWGEREKKAEMLKTEKLKVMNKS
jgi:hypothetical protein